MQPLSFSDCLSADSSHFRWTPIFDNYFSFSGRTYRVIEPCIVNDQAGYSVEEQIEKPNFVLNVLKVMSFATVIIPVVMGIGKWIARRNVHFFKVTKILEEQSADVAATTNQLKASIVNTKQIRTKVLDPEPSKVEAGQQAITRFKKAALATFKAQQLPTEQIPDFSLSDQNKELLIQALFESPSELSGVKTLRGGVHLVIFLDTLPKWVFKPMESKKASQEYVQVANQAREVVKDLPLLHVPHCQELVIDEEYFVMQERSDLMAGSYEEQKGIYSYCWQDQEMKEYMRQLFIQLAIFICKTGFSDVKYDNIPLTQDGRVALIDLDRNCALTGLVHANSRKKNGLFKYIPLAFLKEFIDLTKPLLDTKISNQLSGKCYSEYVVEAEKRSAKAEKYLSFAKANGISCATQKLDEEIPDIFNDSKKQTFAKFILHSLNEQLTLTKNFTVKIGRKITFTSTTSARTMAI